ncbi:hypothetical protein Plec18167_008481 [Paecilomyces lecythidis]|uniref:Uncharacterized protein n=1 Tax=Paecilomyces lecythidis TaxID=3004212 RepID=A0ABR3WWG4_9EURO
MPNNPLLEGSVESDELCRFIRTMLVFENIDQTLEERFQDVPPEFDPAALSGTQPQESPMDMDEDDDGTFELSGVPASAINGDPARLSRRRRVDEERNRALEAIELELREPGDLSQTPREYFIKPRTIDWVRSFAESSPEAPEEYNVTQSTTSPVPVKMRRGTNLEDDEDSMNMESTSSEVSPPQVQYMAHNRRWGLRDVDVIPTIEEENSADVQGFEQGEIKAENESMDWDWMPIVPSDIIDDADQESNGDTEELPSDRHITMSGRAHDTRDAPSPPASSQPGGMRRRREAGITIKVRNTPKNKVDTANENQQASKARKRQRSPSDNSGGSENEQYGSKKQRPLRRSVRLAEAGKASSI